MQFPRPKVSMEESCPFVDWPPSRRRPGGSSLDVPAKNVLFSLFRILTFLLKVPMVGKAEKLKLHEAIPPFSLMEDSIQGKRAETLVKTEKSCWLQLFPSLVLTIPTRTWAPSSFIIVSGPPLSP